jgi:hypothetical protein
VLDQTAHREPIRNDARGAVDRDLHRRAR